MSTVYVPADARYAVLVRFGDFASSVNLRAAATGPDEREIGVAGGDEKRALVGDTHNGTRYLHTRAHARTPVFAAKELHSS